jgi:outer membrane protein OmpA-like peptidoglycan-associated protein
VAPEYLEESIMKSRYLLSLPLAASLMVPAAFAQQSGSSSDQSSTPAPASQQVAPAAQSQTTPDANGPNTNNNPDLSAHQPLQQETRQGFWGKINPFARKKYVQRQMQPIRDRMNELDELSATNSKNIKDVDARAQAGISQASQKADLADQHAVDAGNRAQAAQQSVQTANNRLDTVQQTVSNLDQYQPVSDTEIRFRAGQQVLSSKAKEALDQLADQMKNQRGTIVQVQGFASGRGTAAISNSQSMADSVVRYLVISHDIPLYRIYTIGVGNAPVKATAEGTTPKRITGGRVEVALMKNGIADLPQSASVQNNGAVNSAAQQQAPAANQQPVTTTQPAGNVNNNSSNPAVPRD